MFANVVGLLVFLTSRTDRMLAAVIDPLHPDWGGMERAFSGFTLYAVSLFGAVAMGLLVLARVVARRRRASEPVTDTNRTRASSGIGSSIALAAGLTAAVVLVLIEVLLFQDYGIHFYEFDVFGILADAALRRDLGIQPAEVLRVTTAAAVLLGAELLLCALAMRVARWRDGALVRACGTALLVAVPGGLALFHAGEEDITSDRAEFEGVLPFGRQLLFRNSTRPYLATVPRVGAGGYPVFGPGDPAPVLTEKKNIVFFVADGLRGDMVSPELTPNLMRFGMRPDVIHSRRHYSTGHVSEAGIFGLLYGLRAQDFHAFIGGRIPAYPVELLKRNGYRTLLLASSRLSPYPSDQLVRTFDDVRYPSNDDEAMLMLRQYVDARRADGKPYFVLAFVYTPHYPFTSAKPQFRHYPSHGPAARTNYMNDVLQADDYFRQTLDIVRADFDQGRTVLLATADHGEEIRDHGVFGHASATFWNEKIVVPFFLGLPGSSPDPAQRAPAMSNHTDVWATIFDYLGATPRLNPATFSDGRSLLRITHDSIAYVAGRFFPYADRPSVLIDASRKYWFRVAGVAAGNRLCIAVSRVTDLEDRSVNVDPADVSSDTIPAFHALQSTFWRFILPGPSSEGHSGTCHDR